jgi:hypothetical protein
MLRCPSIYITRPPEPAPELIIFWVFSPPGDSLTLLENLLPSHFKAKKPTNIRLRQIGLISRKPT